MGNKYLVVVESPSKEKYIKKFLGKDYEVKASKGHVVDLPKKDLAIDTEKGFTPKYVVTNKKALSSLKAAFKGKDGLVLAVDPDREGEAIGWHVAQKLGVVTKAGNLKKGKDLRRIVFSEITKEAVRDALEKPRKIDMDLVNAQQTRRILDRLVGYKLSPLLWKKIRYGLSAGRVQSVALRILVDRELERKVFDPEEYWVLSAKLGVSELKDTQIIKYKDGSQEEVDIPEQVFVLDKKQSEKFGINNERKVDKVLDELLGLKWMVASVEEKTKKRNPFPPFKTSTMQQAASNVYGFNAQRTMSAAQKLYEKGLITYMRTDSTNMSKDFVDKVRKYIRNSAGEKYLSIKPRVYKTKQKVAQEAHEAVRPTDVSKDLTNSGVKLTADEQKLYKLIWRRSVATQASEAVMKNMKIIVNAGKYEFSLSGSRVEFEGYMKFAGKRSDDVILPEYKEGQELFAEKLFGEQKYTQPPNRYSEAGLIKQLEKYGVGRPSTYAPIISTIVSRGYVEKEQKSLVPTDTGIVVVKLLKDHFPKIVDYDFTAEMEDSLDMIANGELVWGEFLEEFYGPFEKNIKQKEKQINKEDYNVLGDAPKDVKCPDCGGAMVIKLSRYGKFYSCKKWPDCKGMAAMEEDGLEKVDTNSESFREKYGEIPQTDDGRDYLLKKGRYGYFFAHPDYPKKKDIKSLEYSPKIQKELFGRAPKAKDGTKMVLKRGRFGEFWAHPDYPKVKELQSISKKGLAQKKKELELLQ